MMYDYLYRHNISKNLYASNIKTLWKYRLLCIFLSIIVFTFAVSCGDSTNADSVQPATTSSSANWWEGGDLHEASIAEWKEADYANKLATSGDWLAATTWKGALENSEDFDEMRRKAELLVRSVNQSLVDDDALNTGRVSEVVLLLLNLSTEDFRP